MKVPANVLKVMRNAARQHGHPAPHVQPRRAAGQGRRQVRARPNSGPATARAGCRSTRGSSGSCPRTSKQRIVRRDRFAAHRPRVRLRLADEGQRRDRDREVLPAAPLRDQEGLPPPEPPQARQLLPEQLMGVIRAEPARVTDWAAKSVGAAWRAFDLQLTTYAGLLLAIGLVMAYTNSVEARIGAARGRARRSAAGLMWAAIAVVVFVIATVFDYHWLKTLAWPIYASPARPPRADPGDRRRRRRVGALGLRRAADLPVQRDRQDPHDHRAGELPGVAPGQARLARRRSSARASSSGPPLVLVMLQPDLGTSLVFGAILAGMLWMSGASLRWLVVLAVGVVAMVPIAWTYLLRDYQKARLTSLPQRQPGHPGRRLPALPGADRGRFGRVLRQGPDQRDPDAGRLPAGPGDRLRVRHARRGTRVHRRRRHVRPVHPAALARPRRGLAVARCVRHAVRGGRRIDDPVPARSSTSGMVLGVMPITGIPLPFVTHGGASLVSMAAGLGILQSINIRQTKAVW